MAVGRGWDVALLSRKSGGWRVESSGGAGDGRPDDTQVSEANGLRVIAPSRPGYLGTPPETGPTPLAQADALAALLDALGIDSCPVIGHCTGGLVGYLLAARHADRVRCLVAISTPTDPDVGVSPALLRIGCTRPVVALVLARDRRLLHQSAEAAARHIIGEDSTLPADSVVHTTPLTTTHAGIVAACQVPAPAVVTALDPA